MPNEKTAVSEFLNDLKPTSDPFKDVTTEDINPVVEKEEETVVEDKPIPFHKDPKVLRFIEKEVAKKTESLKPSEPVKIEKGEDEITDVLVRIIGNDTPEKQQGVKDLRKVLGSLEDKAAQRALSQFQEQANEVKREDQKAQSELDDYFEEIEDTYGVDISSNAPSARKARSEFIDFVRDIAPKNEEGEVAAFPDLVKSFEIFQERTKKVAQPSRAKELASRSMSRSTDASNVKETGDKSWKSVERLFSKLSS